MNYGVAAEDLDEVAAQLHHRPADRAAALQPADPRARHAARRPRRADQRPALPDRDRPRRQHGHQRQRALALLRGDAPRRRARRRPRDRGRRRSAPRCVERSHLEIDFSLGFPTRFSYGLMLGAQLLSLYGRDTQHAFGHLGFTNMLAWADPERGDLGRRPQQRQADHLPRGLPLPRHDAADHERDAEGGGRRAVSRTVATARTVSDQIGAVRRHGSYFAVNSTSESSAVIVDRARFPAPSSSRRTCP